MNSIRAQLTACRREARKFKALGLATQRRSAIEWALYWRKALRW